MKTLTAITLLAAVLLFAPACTVSEKVRAETEQKQDDTAAVKKEPIDMTGLETATFGAGCFWGVEATFRNIEGVVDTAVGFMGGKLDSPSYKDVCYRDTGHAEVVQVYYDPEKVSYEKLLETFWACHNPTTLNRQGPDVGDQYRSVIFYHSPEQKAAAEKSKAAEDDSGRYTSPIVTQIAAAKDFWKAEEYHQRYLEKKGLANCHI